MFHRPTYSTTGGGGAAESATTRSLPLISVATPLWVGPVFHSSSSVMTITCRSMPTGLTYRRGGAAPLPIPSPNISAPTPHGAPPSPPTGHPPQTTFPIPPPTLAPFL